MFTPLHTASALANAIYMPRTARAETHVAATGGGAATLLAVTPKRRLVAAVLAVTALAVGLTLRPPAQDDAAEAASRRADVFFTGGERLVRVARPVDAHAPLGAALRALLAGPTAAERASGLRTQIPAGTRLRGVSIRNGITRVDLTRRFEAGGGSLSMRARLAQLVYTATQFPAARAMRLMLDGVLVESIGGEGLLVGRPLRRPDVALGARGPSS
jgi:hypothetical protein